MTMICEAAGCTKNACYRDPARKRGVTHCARHRLEGMINPRHGKDTRICIHDDHKGKKPKRATYNLPGLPPRYCKPHADQSVMVNVTKRRMCIVCKEHQPSYGEEGKKATHCSKCAKKSGLNLVDVVSNLCEYKGCNKNATRGYAGKSATRCRSHIKKGMIDVKNSLCICCKKCQPTYNIVGQPARYCRKCKQKGMINVRRVKCAQCHLVAVNRVTDLCANCNPNAYVRVHENSVIQYLRECKIDFATNRKSRKCSYTPDILIDCKTHCVVVEVDEDRHCRSSRVAEVMRMMEIFIAINTKCVFIRYNPDVFRNIHGVIDVPTTTRLETLRSEIEHHMSHEPSDIFSVYRLYYNNVHGRAVQRYDTNKHRGNKWIEDLPSAAEEADIPRETKEEDEVEDSEEKLECEIIELDDEDDDNSDSGRNGNSEEKLECEIIIEGSEDEIDDEIDDE